MSIDLNDIVGARVNHLIVVSRGAKVGRNWTYLCRCDCGQEIVVRRFALTGAGRKQGSCGCVRNEAAIEAATARIRQYHNLAGRRVHGLSKAPAYARWGAMIQRCKNKNDAKFHRYGGRGIRVCDRWLNFLNFYSDMGDPPTPNHSLDRIDVNGKYEPGNCRWATQKTQQNNRANTRMVTHLGRTQCLTAWAEETGISAKVLRQRIDRDGFSPDEAMSKPLRKWPPKGGSV